MLSSLLDNLRRMREEVSSSRHPNKQRSDSQSQSETREELEETEYYNGGEEEDEDGDEEESNEAEDDPEGEDEEGDENDETGDYDKEEVDSVDGTEDEQEEAGANSGSDSVTLTDPEVLDCPICYNPLTSPVFQCENGHIACSSCCNRLVNKCPTCSSKIGYRNRAIEKVLEATKVKCKYAKYGCNEAMNYSKKRDHEKGCPYAPCFCPLTDCHFIGSSSQLYQHFTNEHKNSAVQFLYNNCFGITVKATDQYHILQEEKDGILFILNNSKGDEHLGNAISITCIGPMGSGSFIPYDISASSMSGLYTVKFESSSTFGSCKQDDKPSTGFLVIPSYFFSSDGQFKLDVRIFRSRADRRIKVRLF